MEKLKVLLVEDDPYIAHSLSKKMKNSCEVELATHKNQALYHLEMSLYDVLVTDLNLTHQQDLHGLTILKKAKEKNLYSIVLSQVDDKEVTRKAYELGCDHFLTKLHFETSLIPYLENYQRTKANDSQLEILRKFFFTNDSSFLRELRNLLKVNLENQCLLLTGETGVGKSHFAKTYHQLIFPDTPFVSFNCSRFPESLIDSELFGHKKGAFTGANKDHKGLLERANGGVLFLDEIGTMPLHTQQKLLKAIEEKEFTQIGYEKNIKVDFTLISATCDDLNSKTQNNTFRKDFFFRISGYELEIPALRERENDIEVLLYSFLSQSPRKFFIEEEVVDFLKEYSWPGNTRELKKLIDTLSRSDLGIIKKDCPYLPKFSPTKKGGFLSSEQEDFIFHHGLPAFTKSVEQAIFQKIYEEEKGKATKIIRRLKISNSTYYRIFKESDLTSRS